MEATFYTLKNDKIEVTLTNYGARLTALVLNDVNGKLTDVIAGFASLEGYYQATSPYYGATIGRFANRIANGRFNLNGQTYQLPVNNGENTLHGGGGFQDKIWEVKLATGNQLVMEYTSADGEDGFPGSLIVQVYFSLKDDAVQIDYEATTDAPTVLNLTNHAYFNLNGEDGGHIGAHKVMINADQIVPVNANLIPTGSLMQVKQTPFDFTEEHTIDERIETNDEQLQYGRGYDHTYVLNKPAANELSVAARVTGNQSGIYLEVQTTEPGMQFYTGNFMDGTNKFKSGVKDDFRTAFALETQHFPDSPNQPLFPSTILNPGNVFRSTSVYKFGLCK